MGAVAVFYYLYSKNKHNARLINYQEFKSNLLEKGEVECVDIVNKQTAFVYLRPDSYMGRQLGVESGQPHFYFDIGSADVFEKNVVKAQKVGYHFSGEKRRNWAFSSCTGARHRPRRLHPNQILSQLLDGGQDSYLRDADCIQILF